MDELQKTFNGQVTVTIQLFVKCWKHFLTSSILHIYSLKLAISFKVRATRFWNMIINFFWGFDRAIWLAIYSPAILTLFQILSDISGSCHLSHFLKVFLWIYLSLLHMKNAATTKQKGVHKSGIFSAHCSTKKTDIQML